MGLEENKVIFLSSNLFFKMKKDKIEKYNLYTKEVMSVFINKTDIYNKTLVLDNNNNTVLLSYKKKKKQNIFIISIFDYDLNLITSDLLIIKNLMDIKDMIVSKSNHILLIGEDFDKRNMFIKIDNKIRILETKIWYYEFRQLLLIKDSVFVLIYDNDVSKIIKLDENLNIDNILINESNHHIDFIFKRDDYSILALGRIINVNNFYKVYSSTNFVISIDPLLFQSVDFAD